MGRLSLLSRSVAGARVVVTGAASGMGRATAHLFADEGAYVVVADRTAAGVESVADEIRQVHGADVVLPVVADVASARDRTALVDACAGRF
ncbi:MAG: hypothetical protein RL487_1024, partial [Actinomycetota bacterium]